MKILFVLLSFSLVLPVAARAEDTSACAAFDALVARTYNFDEARLSNAQKLAKEGELNRFWERVRAGKAKFLPCLRSKVSDAGAKPFFRFDGSNLLVELDPSLASKRLQVAVYTDAPLGVVVGAGRWVSILTLRGTEGFDVSKASKRALDDEAVIYYSSASGEPISHFDAALLLWGSQSEERATPQLFALANDPSYVQREAALSFLLSQATPQARALVSKVNREGLSDDALTAITTFLQAPPAVTPRARPRGTRAQFLAAFNAVLQGKPDRFSAMMKAAPNGERDAAAVLLPSDLPLLRRVRRRFLVGANEHSLSFYRDFTGVIFAVMAKGHAASTAPKPQAAR